MTTGEEEAYVCKKLGVSVAPPPAAINLEKEKGGMDFSWLPELPEVVLPTLPPPEKKKPAKKQVTKKAKVKETPKQNNTLLGFVQYIAAHVFFGAKALKEMPPPDSKKDSPALYADKMMIQNAFQLFNAFTSAQHVPAWDIVCEKIKRQQNFEMLAFVQFFKEHRELVLQGNILKLPTANKEIQASTAQIFVLTSVHMTLHWGYYIKNLIDKALEDNDLEGRSMSDSWELLVGKGNALKNDFADWNTEETPFAANMVHVYHVYEEIKKWK